MKPAPFEYHRPASLEEALALLARLAPEDGRVLAGGQSLVPIMAFRLARPAHLIDINGLAGVLGSLEAGAGMLRIGALVRHAAFHRPVNAGPLGRLLSAVVRHIAHYPIRVRGTFCGSLAHADPASEWGCLAATLDARMIAASVRGRREIPASRFFAGVMTTALAPDELLTEVQLPLPATDTRVGFEEFSRRAGDFGIAMVLASYRLRSGRIAEARVGVGGAEARPRRLSAAEAALEGKVPEAAAFRDAAEAAAGALEPLEDIGTDASYRRDLVRALTFRVLAKAA
jgi:aerobic carbon-monoxide dehydrogenase medium subunit